MDLNNLTSFMPGASSAAPVAAGGANHLAAEVKIEGTLRFENELLFDGQIVGKVLSDTGNLIIGKNALVKAEIHTKMLTIYGTVEGNVIVSERCELKADSQLKGDLSAATIVVEEGAVFIGKCDVTSNRSGGTDTLRKAGVSGVGKPAVVLQEPESNTGSLL